VLTLQLVFIKPQKKSDIEENKTVERINLDLLDETLNKILDKYFYPFQQLGGGNVHHLILSFHSSNSYLQGRKFLCYPPGVPKEDFILSVTY